MADEFSDYAKLDFAIDRRNREFADFFVDRRPLIDAAYTGFNYMFFTAPDLSLISSKFGGANAGALFARTQRFLKLPASGADSIYSQEMVNALSGQTGSFLKILSNRIRRFPGSSEIMTTTDYAETWNRYKIVLPNSTKDSKVAGNFDVAFAEDDDLTVMKLIKLWMDYSEGIKLGRIASGYATEADMGSAKGATIDFLASAYHFVTKPDGKTLQYWAKYTGIMPTKIPYDVFQSDDSEVKVLSEVPVEFLFSYKEDMDPTILRDFNIVSSVDTGAMNDNTGSYYDENSVHIPRISAYPSILPVETTTGVPRFELQLRDSNDIRGVQQNF